MELTALFFSFFFVFLFNGFYNIHLHIKQISIKLCRKVVHTKYIFKFMSLEITLERNTCSHNVLLEYYNNIVEIPLFNSILFPEFQFHYFHESSRRNIRVTFL